VVNFGITNVEPFGSLMHELYEELSDHFWVGLVQSVKWMLELLGLFSSPLCSFWLWGPQLLTQCVLRAVFVVVKLVEYEADHSPPSSAEVYNAWSFYLHSPVHLDSIVLKHRVSFALFLFLSDYLFIGTDVRGIIRPG
jgi:hypothetical protein